MIEMGVVPHLVQALIARHGLNQSDIDIEIACIRRLAGRNHAEATIQYLCGRISARRTPQGSEQ